MWRWVFKKSKTGQLQQRIVLKYQIFTTEIKVGKKAEASWKIDSSVPVSTMTA